MLDITVWGNQTDSHSQDGWCFGFIAKLLRVSGTHSKKKKIFFESHILFFFSYVLSSVRSKGGKKNVVDV